MTIDFKKASPLRLLERSPQKGLGQGNLGVIIARAGVGKTACLIHIGLHKLLRGEKLVHISLEDSPEKITAYYQVLFSDLVYALGIKNEQETRALIEGNRMILAYLNQSFQLDRLRDNLWNLADKIGYVPDALVVDGLNFTKAGKEMFQGFQEIARAFRVEIWFSALSHRHIPDVNERGIPYPCNHLDELFSIIMQLEPTPSALLLKLLKDHESPVAADSHVKLDPKTFLAMD
ncbi:MAG: hypothetical protein KKE57_12240 [Proteobacteria bacterium]|nr:hypothetical protein [Pseudomonadota bacterium]